MTLHGSFNNGITAPGSSRGEPPMKPCCARCRRGIKGFGELPCGYPDGCPNEKCGHAKDETEEVERG